MAVDDWHSTASLNVLLEGINTAEGMARSDVNNVIRAMAAAIKAKFDIVEGNNLAVIEDYGGSPAASGATNRNAFQNLVADNSHVALSVGETYTWTALVSGTDPYYDVAGAQPIALLPSTLKLFDGRGATITASAGRGITGDADRSFDSPGIWSYLAANVTAGDVSVTLETDEGAKYATDDLCYYRFGSFSYDEPQGLDVGFMRVKSVSGDVVTFTMPFPESFTITDVDPYEYTAVPTGSYTFNKHITLQNNAFQDLTIRDLNILGSNPTGANLEGGLAIQKAVNLKIERCTAKNVGIGFYVQNGEHVILDSCAVENVDDFQASTGSAYHMPETKNGILRNCRAIGAETFLTAEFLSDIVVEGGMWINSNNPLTGASWGATAAAFRSTNRSRMIVRDFHILGYGGFSLSVTTNGMGAQYDGQVVYEGRLRMDLATEPLLFRLRELNCVLDYKLAGVRETWDFRDTVKWTKRINLKDSMSLATFRGPPGPPKIARVTCSPGLTFGVGNLLTVLYLGNGAGASDDYVSKLVAGETVTIGFSGGAGGSSTWDGRNSQTGILVSTGTGLNTANDWIEVEYEIARKVYADTEYSAGTDTGEAWSAESDMLNQGTPPPARRVVIETIDPASIADTATGTVTVTCTGMTANDLILAQPARVGGWGGLIIQQVVPGTNQCVITLKNETGGAVDLASAAIELHWAKSGIGT